LVAIERKVKAARVQKLQQELLEQEAGQSRLEAKEQRVQQAAERVSERIRDRQESARYRNAAKQSEVQRRVVALTREQEQALKRELDRQQQSSAAFAEQQAWQEAERRREQQQKEEGYRERMRQLAQWRTDRDQQEQQALESRLQSIDAKIARSQHTHQQNLRRVASEAKAKNDFVQNKIASYKSQQQEREREEEEQYKAYQEQVKRKLKHAHKELVSQHRAAKSQKASKAADFSQLKRIEEFNDQRARLQAITARQHEAQLIQEELKQEKAQEFRLKNELRRLREEDIKLLRERKKRLQEARKHQILARDLELTQFAQQLRTTEALIHNKKL
jgi:hypothetical protein